MITISQALKESVETLRSQSDSPNLDAQLLLANKLEKPRAWIISHPEHFLSETEYAAWQEALTCLANGVPLPYIIGHWEFFGLDFRITPDTLIPRPETEIIVEHALDWLQMRPYPHLVADIGTGSGCIAIAIAKNAPNATVIGTDISYPALQVAVINAQAHQVDQKCSFLLADLLPPLNTGFDLICANLPYIPESKLPTMDVYEREPQLALDGGYLGLEQINRMLSTAPQFTNPGGVLLIEIESTQGLQVLSTAKRQYPLAKISLIPDLAGYDRVLKIQQPGKSING